MTSVQIFILIVLLVSGISFFFHTYVKKEKLLKTYTWYNSLGKDRKNYDWDKTIERTKIGYLLCFLISTVSLLLSYLTKIDSKFYMLIVVLSLLIFVFISRPVKK
ncbi:MAG: hypothetical protein PUG67_05130 [Peptoniphilaceae bacterium]|nr:hypothetical protein [Peptoniphilaceae bacterium]MDY6018937.1 hypothetical protein [Anaerococcus sp.]